MTKYLLVTLGGGIGSLVRYVVGTSVAQHYAGRFPLGTFVVNITGSFLIGLLMTYFTERLAPHPELRLLLVVGFLGGYTTFSSFEYEIFQSARAGGQWLSLAYVMASVIVGYAGVWLGVLLASRR